jgi:hypothetical protein
MNGPVELDHLQSLQYHFATRIKTHIKHQIYITNLPFFFGGGKGRVSPSVGCRNAFARLHTSQLFP